VFTVLTIGVLFLMFSTSGNVFLLPYVNSYLAKKVDGAKVKLTMLKLKPSSIDALVKVNDSINVKLHGPIDLFEETFNISYKIDAIKIKSEKFTLKKPLHIQGNIKGRVEKMHISGEGKAFASNIIYDLNIIENKPQNIKMHIKNASIAEILTLTGQKPYAKGMMSLTIDMPTLDTKHPKGKARIKISNGLIYAKNVKEVFNISLPTNTALSADLMTHAKGENLHISGDISTSLAILRLSQTKYKIKDKILFSNYKLLIPNLAKLNFLTQTPLRGKLKLNGDIRYKDNQVIVNGMTPSFGGKSHFTYTDDKLKATFKGAQTDTLFAMFKQPKYADGKVDGTVTFESIEKRIGVFDLRSKGNVNTSVVKKTLDLDLGKKFVYNGSVSGKLKNGKVQSKTKWQTTMATLDMPNIIYDLKKGALLSSFYKIQVPDMAKLQSLTQRRYRGDMVFNGKISYSKQLLVTGKGKEFDGTVDFKLVDTKLKAYAKGATVSKIMHMLDYPQVLEAMTEAKIDYDFATQSGRVDALMDNTRILPNTLTKLIKEFSRFNFSKERYNNTRFIAKMTKKMIKFSFNASNKRSYIKVPKGIINKKSEKIHIKVDMKIEGKDFQATVTGTLNRPKVKLDSSAYLKSKAVKEVDKLIEKHKNKLPAGIDEQQIKGFLKSFL